MCFFLKAKLFQYVYSTSIGVPYPRFNAVQTELMNTEIHDRRHGFLCNAFSSVLG